MSFIRANSGWSSTLASLYHSTDLIDWEIVGHAFNWQSQPNMRGTAPSGGVFPQTLRYHEKSRTYYMITTLFDILSPPAVTRTPRSFYDEDSWSNPTYVDQSFICDGKTYLTTTMGSQFEDPDSGYFAVWITEIDIKTGDSLTMSKPFHVLSLPMNTPRLAEGSHIYKLSGYYYLMTAKAGTENGHRAMIKRAKSLNGTWGENPNNPILFNRRNLSNPILATGHALLVSTPNGKWYDVSLTTRPQNPQNGDGKPQLGREPFLAPAEWAARWLLVNGGNDITFNMPGLYDLARPKKRPDDFRGKLADKGYYTPRTPYKRFHSFTRSGLKLKANAYTLDDRETPATLMRNQLDFNPTNPRHEVGATVFFSIRYHNEVGITLHSTTKQRVLFIKTRSVGIPSGPVKLFIKAEPTKYSLGYAVGNGQPNYIAEAFLPGWQIFTGTFFGVYSTGLGGVAMLAPADFRYVHTELLG
ncbi:hypothetical protein L873DRAFT_1835111 [Choiromyces venosus 120613-1]|uniref:Beta-xylosidase C-terminal Concanavalin A-like domain-containing protein n=1 Tax=Choiromyces venosus 120613-1 TaxID=1336337 RepID=A0A3N4JPW8_9PEZI|nr:hypothetical protein L873DRAFT_1835111 [Choiromyces venosus 120613-1]